MNPVEWLQSLKCGDVYQIDYEGHLERLVIVREARQHGTKLCARAKRPHLKQILPLTFRGGNYIEYQLSSHSGYKEWEVSQFMKIST